MADAKICKCGHSAGDHAKKSLTVDKKIVKAWLGRCLVGDGWFEGCKCKLFNHVRSEKRTNIINYPDQKK